MVWESDERILFGAGDFRCVLCGLPHFPLRVECMFYQIVEDGLPRKKGDVCLDCLLEGQDAAVERARTQAQRIRANKAEGYTSAGEPRRKVWAADQMTLAQEIEEMTAWPTPFELEEARAAIAEVEARLE